VAGFEHIACECMSAYVLSTGWWLYQMIRHDLAVTHPAADPASPTTLPPAVTWRSVSHQTMTRAWRCAARSARCSPAASARAPCWAPTPTTCCARRSSTSSSLTGCQTTSQVSCGAAVLQHVLGHMGGMLADTVQGQGQGDVLGEHWAASCVSLVHIDAGTSMVNAVIWHTLWGALRGAPQHGLADHSRPFVPRCHHHLCS
jgi:hypothetical protein